MEIYVSHFVVFILIFLRTTSLIVTAPIFGNQAVPVQFKAALGLFLSLVLLPLQLSSAPVVDTKLLGLAVLAVQEVIVGAMIGFATGLVFEGIRFAGDIIGFGMGFTLAETFDPETNASTAVVGEMMYTLVAMYFILLNGHHFILESLQLSYASVPFGHLSLSIAVPVDLVKMTGAVFVVAMKFAAPVMVAVFLADVTLAILTRITPQMNIFGVAFALKIGVGLIVLISSLPVMIVVFKKLLGVFENDVLQLVKVLS